MKPIKKILIPLDGSPLAEKVLIPAVTLAQSIEATLLLVRVCEPVMQMPDENLREQVLQIKTVEVNEYIQQITHSPLLKSVNKESLVVHGSVADSLVDAVVEHEVDLVMMSSHGRSGIGRWVYGSIAEKVIRRAHCDKIIMRAGADKPLFSHKRILLTLDGSKLAEKAIEPAIMIANAIAAELILLRVTNLPQIAVETVDPLVMKQDLDELEARQRVEAKAYLDRVKQSLQNDKVPVHIEVISGAVAETIQMVADNHLVDLIVISSHGRSGISRWVYGSIAEKVLRNSTCSIYIKHGADE
jgi:nucleotide-binding universal stress UspA family protein